jgi:hypothetical protein
LRWFFLLIQISIRIVAIRALILIEITGSHVKPVKLSRGPLLPAGDGDGIALVASSHSSS